jgi:hypothetical protein
MIFLRYNVSDVCYITADDSFKNYERPILHFFAIPRRLLDAMSASHHPNPLSNYHTFFYGHRVSFSFLNTLWLLLNVTLTADDKSHD